MEPLFFFMLGLAGFGLTLFLFKIGIPLAIKCSLTDQPDGEGGRKQHEGAVPLIGGLLIVPVFGALCLIANLQDSLPLLSLFGGVILLLLIGALDDKFHIHPWVRFVVQIWVASYVVIFCGANLPNLGNLFGFGEVRLGWFGPFFSVTCLVLLMNAINMLDGVDGLVGGFLVVALGWLMVAFGLSDVSLLLSVAFLFVMPILGFLIFNARYPGHQKASVFLGDAGSLSLALILGWLAIASANPMSATSLPPVSIIWIMTLPILDCFAIFFVRMKQGRSPFDADRLHCHHQLIDRGIPIAFVMPILAGVALVTGAVGV